MESINTLDNLRANPTKKLKVEYRASCVVPNTERCEVVLDAFKKYNLSDINRSEQKHFEHKGTLIVNSYAHANNIASKIERESKGNIMEIDFCVLDQIPA